MHLRIASIQMCSSNQFERNLETVSRLVKSAVREGASWVILPEMFAIFSEHSSEKIALQALFGQGIIQTFLRELALSNNIYLISGTIPIQSSDLNRPYSSCLVYNPKGVCIARYDKIHLFDAFVGDKVLYQESSVTMPGRNRCVFEVSGVHIGLAICYDIRFPELFRSINQPPVDIIFIPSAFTVPTGEAHWDVLLRARAIENLAFVVTASQGGTHSNGRQTYGHSMIVDPWGKVIGLLNHADEGILLVDIDLGMLKKCRTQLPALSHRVHFN